MNKSKQVHKKKLDTLYVFSKNNQVFIKNQNYNSPINSTSNINNEWSPISFQWKH